MRQLLPELHDPVDPYDVYADGDEWGLRLGMVLALNGGVADEEGWTNRLGGVGDRRVFRVLRAGADAIMVGAGTIRTGRQGPHRLPPDLRARRDATGRHELAALVVVTNSLVLDWTLPVFRGASAPTIVVTSEASAAQRGGTVPESIRILPSGDQTVDLRAGLDLLRDQHGMRHILCEGGPTLASTLLQLGLVDELCLTLAPQLGSNFEHGTIVDAGRSGKLELRSLLEDDGALFVRYGVR